MCACFIMSAYATSEPINDEIIINKSIEYFDDGSYLEIIVAEENNGIAPYASTYNKSGTKSYNLKNSDGEVLWTFTLKGTFTVNTGVSATCTAATYTTSNIASGWSLYSASTSKSSNKAMADFVFKHKVLFVTTQTVEKSLTLTCDVNGNLS